MRPFVEAFIQQGEDGGLVVGSNQRGAPCAAATLAAAASSTPFLRRPPWESSRTRAVAVVRTTDHGLTASDEPLRQVSAEAVRVLDRHRR